MGICLVLSIFCSDHFISIFYLVFWPFCLVSDLSIISAFYFEYLLGAYHSDHLLEPLLADCFSIIFVFFFILFFENCFHSLIIEYPWNKHIIGGNFNFFSFVFFLFWSVAILFLSSLDTHSY